MMKNIYAWLDERLGFDDMYKMLLDRPESLFYLCICLVS